MIRRKLMQELEIGSFSKMLRRRAAHSRLFTSFWHGLASIRVTRVAVSLTAKKL